MSNRIFHLRILGDLGFEYWVDVLGYEGLYQVSTYGRVKSLGNDRARKTKILKPKLTKDGYEEIGLCKDGKRKMFKVHRIVGMAFLPRFNKTDTDINHKLEFEKVNNRVENLEWCSRKFNINYATHNERMMKNRKGKNACKPVLQFDLDGNFVKEWPSIMEVERQLGFNNGNISACCLKKQKTSNGFLWRFA